MGFLHSKRAYPRLKPLTSMCVRVCVCMCVCLCVCMPMCVLRVCVYVCMPLCVLCVCVCVCDNSLCIQRLHCFINSCGTGVMIMLTEEFARISSPSPAKEIIEKPPKAN